MTFAPRMHSGSHRVPFHGGRRAFSLLELVVVVVILATIAAIAIPRTSRGSEGAAESATATDLSRMRRATEMYRVEHGGAPPPGAVVTTALTQFTDDAHDVSATRTTTHILGPYLNEIPPVKTGPNKGSNAITLTAGGSAGWLYTASTGFIRMNTPIGDTGAEDLSNRVEGLRGRLTIN